MRIDQIAARAALLEERIASGQTHQEEFLEEHEWSPARWLSDWSAGVRPPDVRLWQEATDLVTSITCGEDEASFVRAEEMLQQAERAEARARTTWERYRNATIRGGEMLSELEQECEHAGVVATATGLGIAVAVPAAIIAGGFLAAAGLGTAAVVGGSAFVGALVGGAVGGTSGAAGSTIVESARSFKTGAGYEFDDAALNRAAADSALYGAIGGVTAGGAAMTEATVGLKTLVVQLWEGASGQVVAMAQRAVANVTSSAFRWKLARASILGVGARSYYDIADMTVFDHEKTHEEMFENYAKIIGYGGLGSMLFTGPIAYHYVALDMVSDTSRRYLVDVRENYGDKKGYVVAGGALAAENGAAMLLLRRALGTWKPAVITTLGLDAVSILIETRYQFRAGRDWETIDPGRYIGSCVWGHTAVILPKEILTRAVSAVGISSVAARTTQLSAEYLFVVPSMANAQAKMNNQNGPNVLAGELTRHAAFMGPARLAQAIFGPEKIHTFILDEAIGIITIDMLAEWFNPYEGIPIWSEDLLARIRTLEATNPDEMTTYFSVELGERSLEYDGEYVPSPENLALAQAMLQEEGRETERRLFHQYYLTTLDQKGDAHTVQEAMIFQQFANDGGAPVTIARAPSDDLAPSISAGASLLVGGHIP